MHCSRVFRMTNPSLSKAGKLEAAGHYHEAALEYRQLAEANNDLQRIALNGLQRVNAKISFHALDYPTAKADFAVDPIEYAALNPDLKVLGECKGELLPPLIAARLNDHYLDYGHAEGRCTSLLEYSKNIQNKQSEADYAGVKATMFEMACSEFQSFLAANKRISLPIAQTGSPRLAASVVMVLHNKAALTFKALRSLENACGVDLQLIIVDNNSTDETKELLTRIDGDISIISNSVNEHFLRSCNQAIGSATNPNLCIVNNDVILDPHCILNAIKTLDGPVSCSIVGGMILHLDGHVQDAGSVVFSDGSCQGIGRRCLPTMPQLRFAREVDYVSGCFLATKLETIKLLKGFDKSFEPAYYEETDLCFRAAKEVGRVLYQPACIAWHYEYGSSSTEQPVENNPFLLMAKNKKIFNAKHSERLSDPKRHLSPCKLDLEDVEKLIHGYYADKPKVLFVDDGLPSDVYGAGLSRANAIIKELIKKGVFVTSYLTDGVKRGGRRLHSLESYSHEVIDPGQIKLLDILSRRHEFYDIVIVSRHHNQELFRGLMQSLPSQVQNLIARKLVFDVESLFTLREWTKLRLESSGMPVESYSTSDVSRFVGDEVNRLQCASGIICVSEHEANIVRSTLPNPVPNIYHLGHMFEKKPADISFERFSSANAIGFLGAFHDASSPNADSLRWLRDEVLSELSQIFEEPPQLLIAGLATCNECHRLIDEILEKHHFAKYVGKVDEIESFFSSIKIFLAPTRFAAGISHKLHHAASHGVPIVTTDLIAFQMGLRSGIDLLSASNGRDIAIHVHSLCLDFTLWKEMAEAAIDIVERQCDGSKYEATLLEITDNYWLNNERNAL